MKKVVLLFVILAVLLSGTSAAWWDEDFESKFAVNSMVISQDLNGFDWINLIEVDFSTLNSACANADDITVVNETTLTQVFDLNFKGWDGTNTDSDVDVLFKLTEALSADTYDGEYFIYSNNDACPVPTNRTDEQLAADGFETGTIDVWEVQVTTGGTFTANASAKKVGDFGGLMTTNGANNTNKITYSNSEYSSDKGDFFTWIRVSDVSGVQNFVIQTSGGTTIGYFGIEASDFRYFDGVFKTDFIATPVNNTWYRLRIVIDNSGAGNVDYYLYDTDGVFIESKLNGTPNNTGDIGTVRLQASDEAVGAKTTFWDEVSFKLPIEPTYVLGSEEIEIDLNITTVNGENLLTHPMFAFGIDGNITIDFNVFNKNNGRQTIDLNASKTTVQGTGIVIVKDLNLTSAICADQDWNDEPSTCSVSWDYSGVEDGNYTAIGLLKAGASFDFNVGDGNFEIVNDVNLIVQIPINEETGLVIDTSVSSFIVRINANGILSVFDNQIDINGFSVPIGTDFILVEIDTNTPSLFNSRVYSFLFESAQVSEVLQPFLPPVAASILTTVKTLQFENLKPIPNVRLKVFKDLATGRTLIHDSVTDGKGETSIPFIVADIYEIEVLVDGVVIFTEFYIATATTNEHFIFISSTGGVVPPDPLTTPSVVFTPAQKHFNTVDVNLGVIVSTNLANISSIQFFITNNDFNIYDSGIDSAAPADGNTYSVNINDLAGISDTNFPFVSTVIVILTDGTSFAFSASYSLNPDSDNVLNLLIYDMRTEFGCNVDNLSIRCDGLMFLAFFIILFILCAFAAGARGILGGEGLTLIGLVLTMFFVFIAWIPLWLGMVMVFAAMGVILTRTRFIGA